GGVDGEGPVVETGACSRLRRIHARIRDRPWRHRPGPPVRGAAYLAELPAEGDGLRRRPPPCPEAAHHRRDPRRGGSAGARAAVARVRRRLAAARRRGREPCRGRARRTLAVLCRGEAHGGTLLRAWRGTREARRRLIRGRALPGDQRPAWVPAAAPHRPNRPSTGPPGTA